METKILTDIGLIDQRKRLAFNLPYFFLYAVITDKAKLIRLVYKG